MAARAARTAGGSHTPSETRPTTSKLPPTPQRLSTEVEPTLGEIYQLLHHVHKETSALSTQITTLENMFIDQDDTLSHIKGVTEDHGKALHWIQTTMETQGPRTPETHTGQTDADPTPHAPRPTVRLKSPSRSRSTEHKPLGYGQRESQSPSPLRPSPAFTGRTSATPGGTPKPKIKEPKHFDRTRGKKAADWMLRIGLWAQYNQSAFDNEQAMVTYILGMTKDKAADWARPHMIKAMKRQPNALATMREFAEEFSKAFEDPDAKRLATRKIGKLSQTSDVESYITEFENLQAELDWNKGALQSAFKRGLHWKVKEILSQIYPAPSTFEDVKSHARCIDATRCKNKASRPQKTQKKSSATTSTTTTTTKSTTKTPLSELPNYVSPEERDKRCKDNLCIKCGSPDHRFKECPNSWSKERKPGKGTKETTKIAEVGSKPNSSSEN